MVLKSLAPLSASKAPSIESYLAFQTPLNPHARMSSAEELAWNDRAAWVDEFLDNSDLWQHNHFHDLEAPLDAQQPALIPSNAPGPAYLLNPSTSAEEMSSGYATRRSSQIHDPYVFGTGTFTPLSGSPDAPILQSPSDESWYAYASAQQQLQSVQPPIPFQQEHEPFGQGQNLLHQNIAATAITQPTGFEDLTHLGLDFPPLTSSTLPVLPSLSTFAHPTTLAERMAVFQDAAQALLPQQHPKRRRISPSPDLPLSPRSLLMDSARETPITTTIEPKPGRRQIKRQRRVGENAAATVDEKSSSIEPRRLSAISTQSIGRRGSGQLETVEEDEGEPDLEQDSALAKRSKRSGPLTIAQREKIEEMRFYGACWRCRRYKKPCNNGAGVCDTCLTSGLRVWPSSLGCRRGDLNEFVDAVLPHNIADVLMNTIPANRPKPKNWRLMLQGYQENSEVKAISAVKDKWYHLSRKVVSTQVFGTDFLELLEIMANYARNSPDKNPQLEWTAHSISSTCDFYFSFVATNIAEAPPNIHSTIQDLRKCYSKAWGAILTACLKGRMRDWLTSFLTACIETCLLIIFTNALISLPESTRAMLWTSTQGLIEELRQRLYATVQDLLSALAKGARPLKFNCWSWEEEAGGESGEGSEKKKKKRVRHKEGMRIMAGDTAAFDGMVELKEWVKRHRQVLDTDLWFTTQPFSLEVKPLMALSRFVKAGLGDYENEDAPSSSSTSSSSSAPTTTTTATTATAALAGE